MTERTSTAPDRTGLNSANPQVVALPNHLRQFAVDQRHEDYTPIDHAVWRYIMRQNVFFLKKYAHRVYFQGLLDTGICINRIPSIHEMNDILGRIGWGAVAVDGFIPPAAFMEFQAYKVLVIACAMRQLHHIEYTPAPDIVHEAAGHAPIIVDRPYAEYLRRFGEIGAKAMSSARDFELYEAIRHLSILKESPGTPEPEIAEAAAKVDFLQKNLGQPSEMALLSRLHWWTVEYGLIGTRENPKIYGAGLLSSIGESLSCLEPAVQKIPYSLDAQHTAFDITTKQPQLFVTPDFEHLADVLEQFAAGMAFSTGGMSGLSKAIECGRVATVVYSSGLQVSGVVAEAKSHDGDQPVFIRLTGSVALAIDGKQLEGHGKERHREGFSSPVGWLQGDHWPLEDFNDDQLAARGLEIGKRTHLIFKGGIELIGVTKHILRRNDKTVLITFTRCTVRQGLTVLFRPEWGDYDMAIGERIVSVFTARPTKTPTWKSPWCRKAGPLRSNPRTKFAPLNRLYRKVRDIRDVAAISTNCSASGRCWRLSIPDDWLLPMEIVELLSTRGLNPDLEENIRAHLVKLAERNIELAHLINQGHFLTSTLRVRAPRCCGRE